MRAVAGTAQDWPASYRAMAWGWGGCNCETGPDGSGARAAASQAWLGRNRCLMLRKGALSITALQGRTRGLPALPASSIGMPVTGSD